MNRCKDCRFFEECKKSKNKGSFACDDFKERLLTLQEYADKYGVYTAQDEDNSRWSFENKPTMKIEEWNDSKTIGENWLCIDEITNKTLSFDGDWEDSLCEPKKRTSLYEKLDKANDKIEKLEKKLKKAKEQKSSLENEIFNKIVNSGDIQIEDLKYMFERVISYNIMLNIKNSRPVQIKANPKGNEIKIDGNNLLIEIEDFLMWKIDLTKARIDFKSGRFCCLSNKANMSFDIETDREILSLDIEWIVF